MRTGHIIVVPATARDLDYCRELVGSLQTRFFIQTWFTDRDVRVGQSLTSAYNAALEGAAGLILVQLAGSCDPFALFQLTAFQARRRTTSGSAALLVISRHPLRPGSAFTDAEILAPTACDSPTLAATVLCAILFESDIDNLSEESARLAVTGARPGAWSAVANLSSTYPQYARTIRGLIALGEYEHASELYWRTLYYSGYQELWGPRAVLTASLADLAQASRHYIGAASVILKGEAYSLIEQRRFDSARIAIEGALQLAQRDRARRVEGSCAEHSADLAFAIGDYATAANGYDHASHLQDGLDEHRTRIKHDFAVALLPTFRSSQLTDLERLKERFATVLDYREGLIEIELAKGYAHAGNVSLAREHAIHAVRFFSAVAHMPRYQRLAWATARSVYG
jgi:hypothetical protein